jgi:hypothetical protein
MDSNDFLANTGVAVLALVLVAIWIGMVVLGVRFAKKKNRSPHWMWFGLHPVGALVVLIVMASLSPQRECPRCCRKVPAEASVCSYCKHEFLQEAAVEREPGRLFPITPAAPRPPGV